jgi:hypothetical protein
LDSFLVIGRNVLSTIHGGKPIDVLTAMDEEFTLRTGQTIGQYGVQERHGFTQSIGNLFDAVPMDFTLVFEQVKRRNVNLSVRCQLSLRLVPRHPQTPNVEADEVQVERYAGGVEFHFP